MASANMLEIIGKADTTTKVISHNLHARTMEEKQARTRIHKSLHEKLRLWGLSHSISKTFALSLEVTKKQGSTIWNLEASLLEPCWNLLNRSPETVQTDSQKPSLVFCLPAFAEEAPRKIVGKCVAKRRPFIGLCYHWRLPRTIESNPKVMHMCVRTKQKYLPQD